MVVIGLGKNLLLKYVLGHCVGFQLYFDIFEKKIGKIMLNFSFFMLEAVEANL